MPVSDETFGSAAGHRPQPSPDAIRTAGNRPARHRRRGLGKDQSGGPRAGSASGKRFLVVHWFRCNHLNATCTCADSARPGTRRMVSPPDRRRPRTHMEVGLSHLPLFRALHPGCPGRGLDGPQEMLWARVPARTLARKDAPCPPQARTGDPPRPSGRQQDPGPVAGFARRSRKSAARQRNRVGHRLPLPDTLTFAHQIRGHSLPPGSKRSRSIRQRERSESATGMEGVEKMGWIFGERAGLRGGGGWWQNSHGTSCSPSSSSDTEPMSF
jgi:hypothetical protein